MTTIDKASATAPIREPQQARSREAMDRIMESLEALLAEKPFVKITMAELARHSGTGTSSIYARFKDKSALILGVHMRLREATLSCLGQLTDPTRWKGKTIEEIVNAAHVTSLRFYRKHGSIIRAALLVDTVSMRERQAGVLRTAAQQFSDLIAAHAPKADRKGVDEAVNISCRVFASLMYTDLLFGDVLLTRAKISDTQLCRQLSLATLSLLQAAMNKGK